MNIQLSTELLIIFQINILSDAFHCCTNIINACIYHNNLSKITSQVRYAYQCICRKYLK